MKASILCLLGAVLITTSCAKSSGEIQASYVSPLQFQNLSCDQISGELSRLSLRAAQLAGVQDSKATDDAIATTAAIVVFWPAAFLVGGDGATAAELARIRGEFEAVEKAGISKGCGIQVETEPRKKTALGSK